MSYQSDPSQVMTAKKRRLQSLVDRHLSTSSTRVDPATLMECCDNVREGLGTVFLGIIKEPLKHSTPSTQLSALALLDAVVQSSPPTFTMMISSEDWTERLFRVAKDGGNREVCEKIMLNVLQWSRHYPTHGLQALVVRFRKSKYIGDTFERVYNNEELRRTLELSKTESHGSAVHRNPSSLGTVSRVTPGSYGGPASRPAARGHNNANSAQTNTNIETFLMETQNDVSLLEYGMEHTDMLDMQNSADCAKHRQKAINLVQLDELSDVYREQLLLLIDTLTRLLAFHDALYGTKFIDAETARFVTEGDGARSKPTQPTKKTDFNAANNAITSGEVAQLRQQLMDVKKQRDDALRGAGRSSCKVQRGKDKEQEGHRSR